MIKTTGNNVVIEIEEETGEKTVNGIILPTAQKEKPQVGIVTAVGPGRITESGERIKPEIEVGNKIVFAKYAGNEVKIDEKSYIIINERDVLLILSD